MDLVKYIRIKEDWPKEGISFKDITTLVQDKDAFLEAIKEMTNPFEHIKIDKVLCADARGFIFGSPIALHIHAGLAIARKPNKLPVIDISESYDLEYGSNTLEIPVGAIEEGDNVLIVDDLLATGGSALALTRICQKKKANIIGYSFLIELTGLKGREKFPKLPIRSVIKYEF